MRSLCRARLILAVLVMTCGPGARLAAQADSQTLAEFTRAELPGDVSQLCWSPDATILYVQTLQPSPQGPTVHHFLFRLDGRRLLTAVDAAPEWAAAYWHWKTARYRPGDESVGIDVEVTTRRVHPGPEPMMGGMSRSALMNGQVGSVAEEWADAANYGETVNIFRLKLNGTVIGDATGRLSIGRTFTWLPPGSGVLAFADQKGRLRLIQEDGKIRRLLESNEAWLPAASPDGQALAFFQQAKDKRVRLSLLTLAR